MSITRYVVLAVVVVLAATVLAPSPSEADEPPSSRRRMLVGVNLPSATFAPHELPGNVGRDYFYPNDADIDYFLSKGMNVIRLGFRWERLQPVLNEPFDPREMQRLDSVVQAIILRDMSVILDLHNYARYRDEIIGSIAVPDESFAEFWSRLAALYGGSDRVIFGLMNEPRDISAEKWQQAAQRAIDRIRETGARNRILVSSSEWSNASKFVAYGGIWKRIIDPGGNFAFEVHQYVDSDNTGTQAECPDALVGVAAIQSVTEWMEQNKRQVFLGEFGASGRSECLTALSHMLKFIRKHANVWLGWTYFAGGRGWSVDDILSIQPASKHDKPQMELLERFIR